MKNPRIMSPADCYTERDYPEAIKYADKQAEIMWFPKEIDVTKDVQDLRINMAPAEKHAVTTTLKLFTQYELFLGNEYWSGAVAKNFPRPEIQRMAAVFAMMELSVHAPFYNNINKALMIDTPEFYMSYKNHSHLAERMKYIEDLVNDTVSLPVSLAVFSMLEGAVLYSSFAFLKSFQANGHNQIRNICAGISFSSNDEMIHADAGAWLFNQLVKEMGGLTEDQYDLIYLAAEQLLQHEYQIIDMLYSEGDLETVNKEDLQDFVSSRIAICLKNLNMDGTRYEVDNNPVADWFYDQVNNVGLHDFFVSSGNSYERGIESTGFQW